MDGLRCLLEAMTSSKTIKSLHFFNILASPKPSSPAAQNLSKSGQHTKTIEKPIEFFTFWSPQELQLRHHLEPQRPKTYENQWNSYDFQCISSPTRYWDLVGAPGASWDLLGPPWGIRGASLGPPWGSLGPPWGPPSPLPPLSPPPLSLRLFSLLSPLINSPTHRCILQSRYSMDM